MEKYELRRRRLEELLALKFKSTQARLAETAEIEPNYLSRLLYPEGKSGKKRIGEDTRAKIENACDLAPGWLDLPLGTGLDARPNGTAPAAREDDARRPPAWPFANVTQTQLAKITDRDRELLEDIIWVMIKRAARDTKTTNIPTATAVPHD